MRPGRNALALAALAAWAAAASPALSATITVRPGESIQDAVDRAGSGDTVSVQPGRYSAFEVRRDGVRVVSSTPGGAHVVSGGRGIQAYGRSNISIEGFRVTAAEDGIVVTGDADGGNSVDWVSNVRIAGNIVADAGKDGIKVAQMRGSQIVGNRIERAGSSGNSNGDGGIDCVTCEGTLFQSNDVTTRGYAGLMLKTNSRANRVVGNTLRNVDPKGVAITVGGVSDGSAAEAAGVLGENGTEASGNVIEGNTLQSASCAIYFRDAANNRVGGNRIAQARDCPTTQGSNTGDANVSVAADTSSTWGGGTGDPPPEDGLDQQAYRASTAVPGACATANGAGSAAAAAGGVAGLFSRGRALASLQVVQQVQLIAIRICEQEQLAAQLRNLTATPLDTGAEITSALAGLRSILGTADATVYDLGRAADAHREQYPVDMGGLATGDVIRQAERWRGLSQDAMAESWRLQSGVVQGQAASQARVGQQVGAVMEAPGMLAAQQGTAQLIASVYGEMQSMQSVSATHYRAVEHSLAQQQAKDARAEELHRRALLDLGRNDPVNVRTPF